MFFWKNEWNKASPEACQTRDPSNSAVSESFQTVSDLVFEWRQPFRNLRYCQEESSSSSGSRSNSSSSSSRRRSGSGGSGGNGSSASIQKLLAAAIVVVVLVCLAPYAIHDSETPP